MPEFHVELPVSCKPDEPDGAASLLAEIGGLLTQMTTQAWDWHRILRVVTERRVFDQSMDETLGVIGRRLNAVWTTRDEKAVLTFPEPGRIALMLAKVETMGQPRVSLTVNYDGGSVAASAIMVQILALLASPRVPHLYLDLIVATAGAMRNSDIRPAVS
jgi:hypothetical protein